MLKSRRRAGLNNRIKSLWDWCRSTELDGVSSAGKWKAAEQSILSKIDTNL